MRTLALAGRRLGRSEHEDEVYDLAIEVALVCLEADAASLSRFDRAEGVARTLRNGGDLAAWEQVRPDDETYRLEGHRGLFTVLLQGRAWNGTVDDPDLPAVDRDLLTSLGKYAALAIPVFVGSDVWGELYVTRARGRERFSDVDLAMAQTLVGLVGAALRHLKDRAVLHEMAYRDRLTGLANRRAVDDRLERIFEHPTLPAPVALVLGDVNGLKLVNDERGHSEGDRLLRQVAEILTREIAHHPGGLAARIGGDEFCLVLEGMDEAEVRTVVSRVGEAAGQLPMGGGLSCGYALVTGRPGGAPTAAAASRALLRLADAMQYREKRQSRADRDRRAADLPLVPPLQHAGGAARGIARELATAAMKAMQAAPRDPERRLEALAASSAARLGAVSWWLSRSDGLALQVRCGACLREPASTPENQETAIGDRYLLADYPISAAALDGGTFFATVDQGERSEREFLAANGYVAVLGVGVTVDGVGWLVELCADPFTQPMAPHEGLLLALATLAVSAPSA